MPEMLPPLLAFFAAFCGWALLALSQERHLVLVLSTGMDALHAGQRPAGAAAIALGLLLCVAGEGPAFGAIAWVLLTSAAALAVSFTLALRPQWLRPIALIMRRPAAPRSTPTSKG